MAFAQSEGAGTIQVTNNVVYANRNFMPFYRASAVPNQSQAADNYGTYLQDYIYDGQGIYTTRAEDYQGYFIVKNNTVFDNGINGISIHKTTDPFVTVQVEDNIVFDNGRTFKTWESRQNAGGIVVNSGDDSSIEATVAFVGNAVTTDSSDTTYQCFGSCDLTSDSEDNTACGGSVNAQYDSSAFDDTVDCDQ